MKLLLNNELIEDNTLPSDYSALRYLREKRGLMGTKEGCASGDCGACTLLVGALENGELHYTTLNSCITPIQSLSGKHLVSVEYLSQQGELHPAQQALVEHHGSQCGFCTPGFVLSLAGAYEEKQMCEQPLDRASLCDAISGNLCRCTGYRPIIDAGLAMAAIQPDHVALMGKNDKVKNTLMALQDSLSTSESEPKNYAQPQNLEQLIHAKKTYPHGILIAGGTDLMLENTQRYHDFGTLIDLSQVAEMISIQDDGQRLTLGASVTYAELERYCQEKYPHIHALLGRIASRQIRNRGTIGGNVANASPIADLPPLLLAFDADIQVLNAEGTTRTVNINDFYKGYKQTVLEKGELIVSFSMTLEKLAQCHRFYKVSKRMEDDISSVMLAARFAIDQDHNTITDVRLAFGGMAATPIRAINAERVLTNASIDDEQALHNAIAQLRKELHPMSDVRASSRYRLDIACSLIRKAWLALNNQEAVTFSGHAVSDAILTTGNEEMTHA